MNYSNTATTGLDFLDQVTRLPVLSLLGKPADMVRGMLSTSMANAPAAPVMPASPLFTPGMLGRAATSAGGAFAAPLGMLAPNVTANPDDGFNRMRAR